MARIQTTALERASALIRGLAGHTIGIITLGRPEDIAEAIFLSKVVSKQTPMIANLLEYAIVHFLNKQGGWQAGTEWVRQDPGFPDTVLDGYQPPACTGYRDQRLVPLIHRDHRTLP